MENGIVYDLPAADYHRIDRVSNSYLSRLNICPAAAKVKQEETPAMIFGSAFHSFILDGVETFVNAFIVGPEADRRTKAGKEAWAEFETVSAGRSVIAKDDMTKIQDMATAIKSHPTARNLLSEGAKEVSVFWTDPFSGLDCKARIDIPIAGMKTLVDVKTVRDAAPTGFQRSVTSFNYMMQAAFYLDGVNAVTREEYDIFAFIAVEKEPPYKVGVYTLSPEFIEYGRTTYKMLINLERQCRDKNEWPNWTDAGATELEMPKWLAYRELQ